MDPQWPNTLPLPRRDGYSGNDVPPIVRTEMESGPAQVVRIATAYVSNFNFSLVVDSNQFATLKSFWDYAGGAGANWFEMPLDSVGQVEWHRVRFTSGLSWTIVHAGKYIVQCAVETEDRVGIYV